MIIFIDSGGGGGGGSATTWDPSAATGTLSGGDLVVTNTNLGTRATAGALASKRYCEIDVGASSNHGDNYFGIARKDGAHNNSAFSLLMRGNGGDFTGGSTGAPTAIPSGNVSFTAGDVLMIAVDTTSGTSADRKVWMGKNGTWSNGDPAAGTGGNWSGLLDTFEWCPFVFGAAATSVFTLNCGAVAFTHTPPSGFSAF